MCKVSKLNICRLVQESFVSPTFNFGEVDISNDTFIYTVTRYLSSNKKTFETEILTNNLLVIKKHDLKIGKYTHELLWIHGNNEDVVFQGDLIITDKGTTDCFPATLDIKVVTENTVVNVAYSQNVIVVEGGGGTSKTKTSQFINDGADGVNPFVSMQQVEAKGYTTFSGSYNDLTNKPTLFSGNYADLSGKPAIPTKTSDLTNDSNFSTFSGDYTDLDNKPALFSGSYTDLTNKPTLFSGNYADLSGKPAIPTKTSELTNDSNFSTFSGDYADLSGKPAIPTKTSDLTNDSNFSTFSGSYTDLTNKPTLFSGNYNDLTNKPIIPTVGNGTITITQGGVSKGTFTTNQSGNTTIEVDAGAPVAVNDSTITFKQGDVVKGTITTNQAANSDVVLDAPGTKLVQISSSKKYIVTSNPGGAKLTPGDNSVDLSTSTYSTRGVSGAYSFGVGSDVIVSGACAVAMGTGTKASANYSFAHGFNSKAEGVAAVAFGYQDTEAKGTCSFTNGSFSKAYSGYSVVFGYYTRAYYHSQMVIGRYNHYSSSSIQTEWTDGSPIFTVGNGSSSNSSNAYQLYNDGRSEQKKDFEIETIGQGVIIKSDDGTRWRIKVNNNGTITTEVVV